MSYKRCPTCGFSVYLRAAFPIVDRCPRCLARRGTAVPMSVTECRSWLVTGTESRSIESRTRTPDQPSDSPDAMDVAAHKFETPIVKELPPEAQRP
jgi:hypothetical protein